MSENTPFSSDEISEHLDQIIGDLGSESISHFAAAFYDDLHRLSGAMLIAANENNWIQVKQTAHALKSTTLSFGLAKLSRFAYTIEQRCKKDGKIDPGILQEWPLRMHAALCALNQRFQQYNLPTIGDASVGAENLPLVEALPSEALPVDLAAPPENLVPTGGW